MNFDVGSFIWSLLAAGGPALVISGWLAQKTGAKDWTMLLQSWGVAIVLTLGESIVGVIPISPGDFVHWFVTGLTNGIVASFLYKLGVFNALLDKLKAITPHQKAQPGSGA